MASLPTGTVTFLFTDIEGSTELLQRIGTDRYAEVLEDHRTLLRRAFREHGGHEISHEGDSFLVVFENARKAVFAAVTAQRAIEAHSWPKGVTVRVRMGLHTGEPLESGSDYVGVDLHRAARICSAGHGGQILLSEATQNLVQYSLSEGMQTLDLGLHRLKDLKHPERIFQILDPARPTQFRAIRSLDVLPSNLPTQLTSFIGRTREVAGITSLLTANRAVTLTGPGGCGKTRLAVQVAAELLGRFPDGVWLIELAPLADPALVPQTVAATLKLPEQPARTVAELLVDFLRSRTVLLVLDNCEQVIHACARLSEELLRACPRLRILATSREVLNIAGEVTFAVPSLSVPDPQPGLSADRLILWEAVQLFVDRASLAQPTFKLNDLNAQSVAEVCRRLDGIPLAIELAAARMSAMTVQQITARLDDRFRLLTGGSRTALPRHQTLRGAIDWSYGLLAEKERVLLRRLSAFAGGWTLEAAEGVCGGVEELDVLNTLTQLAFKSLILVTDHSVSVRYRFLETVRQYARDRLLESGEELTVRKRHRDWYLTFAEQGEQELAGPQQAEWFDKVEAEHDNLRAALEWSLQSGEPEAALRLATAVTRFWLTRAYSDEGRRWLDAGLQSRGSVAASVRARALNAAGYLAVQGQGDYASGRLLFEESLSIWRTAGDNSGVADSLHSLGLVATHQADLKTADSLYRESLAIRRELDDKGGIALALHNLGIVAFLRDDPEARSLFESALALWQELGDRRHIAMALTGMGYVATRQRDLPRARSLYRESLAIRQELGDKWGLAYSIEGLATLAAVQGMTDRAARLLGAVEALREAMRTPLPLFYRPDRDRAVAALRARLGEQAFAAAWVEGRSMTLEQTVNEALMVAIDQDRRT